MYKTDYQTVTETPPAVQEPLSKPPNRNRRVLIIAAVIAVLGLAALLAAGAGAFSAPGGGSAADPTLTATQIIPLVILLVMFVVATKWPPNIGVMGLVASFGLGYFMLGMTDKEILAEFPTSIVLTIIGVTYFFSMANGNGTVDVIVRNYVRLVRGKTIAAAVGLLLLAAVLTAPGTFTPAGGKLHAAGRPQDVLTEDTVRTVFGMGNRVITDPSSGKPLMLPLGRHHVLSESMSAEPSRR